MSIQFVCQNCSSTHPKWAGKCSACNSWNSIIEEVVRKGSSPGSSHQPLNPSLLKDIKFEDNNLKRYSTGIKDLDNVLGGGMVEGSVVMLAGEPGIGKSTLLMQLLGEFDNQKTNALYVTAEESASQVKDRANRLKVKGTSVHLAASQSTEDIVASIVEDKPPLCIVDSIQTIKVDRLTSAPGTVSQVTNSIHALSSAAKEVGCTLVVVGHVTKEGAIAGPKVLEHLVDVVLYIEGDRHESLRVLRSSKNRFGSTTESALLKMGDDGLSESDSISASLISQKSDVDGSIVAAITEGSQPLLVEVQALVSKSGFGYPKRSSSGFDLNRLNILIAVLNKRTKLNLHESDIYINVAGGVKIKDTGADLAVCMAIASAASDKKITNKTVVFGEVGLGGEIRTANYAEKRIKEASNYGFTKVVGPNISKKPPSYKVAASLREALVTSLVK